MKINEHYYTVIRMITDAERTIEHVTARAMEIPDGCSHSFHSHIRCIMLQLPRSVVGRAAVC